jgi:hypothetical protein
MPSFPLVHKQQTTGRYFLPATYQAYRAGLNYPAWAASNNLYAQIDDRDGSRYLDRLQNCRRSSWFARHKITNKVRVFTSSCGLRWCCLCADAKRNFVAHQVATHLRSAHYPKFLTLTLKHSPAPLADQVDALYKFFRSFRKTKLVKQKVRGGIWFFQIKRSKIDKNWHPHLHCIITGDYIPQRQLSRLWLKVTGNSKIVDIKPVKDFVKAAYEAARYSASPADLTANSDYDFKELFDVLHGKRICGTWGQAKQISLRVPKAEDKDSWVSVGSWSTIREQLEEDQDAKAIVNAWLTDEPLDPNISMRPLEKEIAGQIQNLVQETAAPFLPNFYDSG